MYSTEKVIALAVKHVIVHSNTRSYKFGNAALHEFLCKLRIFQLITYSHSPTRSYEFWDIAVEGMMRKASHSITLTCTIVSSCQSDTKDTCCIHSIITICLVEVSTAKQEQSIRMLRLELVELLHHWRKLAVFLCHFYIYGPSPVLRTPSPQRAREKLPFFAVKGILIVNY